MIIKMQESQERQETQDSQEEFNKLDAQSWITILDCKKITPFNLPSQVILLIESINNIIPPDLVHKDYMWKNLIENSWTLILTISNDPDRLIREISYLNKSPWVISIDGLSMTSNIFPL